MKLAVALLCCSALAAPAQAALTIETTDFIGIPQHFNGFEGIGDTSSFTGSYTEDGITVQYVGTPGQIWTTSQTGEGSYSWYPNGGSTGYTRITFATSNAIQFLAGSGFFANGASLLYDVLYNGTSVGTGSAGSLSSYPGFATFGFSGATFNEVRLQGVFGGTAFSPSSYEAGAYDSIAIANTAVAPTPEPEAWASMALGLGLAGWVARRRKARLAAV